MFDEDEEVGSRSLFQVPALELSLQVPQVSIFNFNFNYILVVGGGGGRGLAGGIAFVNKININIIYHNIRYSCQIMVVISLKSTLGASSNKDGFLFETSSSTKVDDLVESLVEIHNARLRSCLIIDAVRGLATHGVMKRTEDAGTDMVQEMIGNAVEKGPNYVPDPSGVRTGNAPDARVADILKQEALSLEEYIDKNQIQRKVALTIDGIEEKMNNVRGALTMAYPMGLPEWDLARMALDDPIDKLKGTYLGGGIIEANDASLWACNKEFCRGQLVSDCLGSCNEKTKVIAKLATKGSGPPAREPIVSEAERNAMTAFYFKRQEELKRLAQADEDDYLNSEWADPKGMKRNLQGLGNVKVPGLQF